MKQENIVLGAVYVVKVSGSLVRVRLDSVSTHGGWHGTSLLTGRKIRIKTAGRLRREAGTNALRDGMVILSRD